MTLRELKRKLNELFKGKLYMLTTWIVRREMNLGAKEQTHHHIEICAYISNHDDVQVKYPIYTDVLTVNQENILYEYAYEDIKSKYEKEVQE